MASSSLGDEWWLVLAMTNFLPKGPCSSTSTNVLWLGAWTLGGPLTSFLVLFPCLCYIAREAPAAHQINNPTD